MNLVPWKSAAPSSFLRSRVSDDLTSFQREMNQLMNNFFSRGDVSIPSAFEASMYPSIDLQEKENKYILDADMPGMKESDIEIDFHNDILTIRGEKKTEKETKDSDYVCVERSTGSFRRDVYLSEDIDQESIKAELKDGVLHVELPKKERGKTTHKKIAIKH